MKKQLILLLPIVAIAMLTGCSTYQYSSRSVDIDRTPIGTKKAAAEIVVDYSRTVTATSEYQLTKNDAIREAEHLCILNSGIDVIVDPIFKVEYSPFQFKKRYKATVTGYAGKYAPAKAGVDAAKEYDMKDIEKYKMITDPSFPQYYYNKSTGDSYYINTGKPQAAGVGAVIGKGAVKQSLAFAPKKQASKVRDFDFNKARNLRNAGIGLTSAGGVLAIIGAACAGWSASESNVSYGYEYDGYHTPEQIRRIDNAEPVGIAFAYIGSLSIIAGVPCWVIGSKRMKNSNNKTDVSMGGTRNGLGLSLRF